MSAAELPFPSFPCQTTLQVRFAAAILCLHFDFCSHRGLLVRLNMLSSLNFHLDIRRTRQYVSWPSQTSLLSITLRLQLRHVPHSRSRLHFVVAHRRLIRPANIPSQHLPVRTSLLVAAGPRQGLDTCNHSSADPPGLAGAAGQPKSAVARTEGPGGHAREESRGIRSRGQEAGARLCRDGCSARRSSAGEGQVGGGQLPDRQIRSSL